MKKSEMTLTTLKTLLSCDRETGKVTRLSVTASDNRWSKLQQVGEEMGYYCEHDGYWRVSVTGIGPIKRAELNWFYFTGEWPPKGMIVDHHDRVRDHDWFDNLRLATRSQNQRNCVRPKNNTSGAKGVTRCKQTRKWMAHIKVDRKFVNCGRYDTFEQASAARALAAYLYHGEFEGEA